MSLKSKNQSKNTPSSSKKKSGFNNLLTMDSENFDLPQHSSTPINITKNSRKILREDNSLNTTGLLNKQKKTPRTLYLKTKKNIENWFEDDTKTKELKQEKEICPKQKSIIFSVSENVDKTPLRPFFVKKRGVRLFEDPEEQKTEIKVCSTEDQIFKKEIQTNIEDVSPIHSVSLHFNEKPIKSYSGRKKSIKRLFEYTEDKKAVEVNFTKKDEKFKPEKQINPKKKSIIHSLSEHFDKTPARPFLERKINVSLFEDLEESKVLTYYDDETPTHLVNLHCNEKSTKLYSGRKRGIKRLFEYSKETKAGEAYLTKRYKKFKREKDVSPIKKSIVHSMSEYIDKTPLRIKLNKRRNESLFENSDEEKSVIKLGEVEKDLKLKKKIQINFENKSPTHSVNLNENPIKSYSGQKKRNRSVFEETGTEVSIPKKDKKIKQENQISFEEESFIHSINEHFNEVSTFSLTLE